MVTGLAGIATALTLAESGFEDRMDLQGLLDLILGFELSEEAGLGEDAWTRVKRRLRAEFVPTSATRAALSNTKIDRVIHLNGSEGMQ